ncbi:hypothetical protein [Tabrizicola sp. BL-A-41-H6]|uniref:hypothetical protein n=1 Tax=Tabrizicola sp. BL-A-41-H6 TaxID=3421107 RepID=UPI003D665B34
MTESQPRMTAPIRAERRQPTEPPHHVPATPGGLIRSTLGAAVSAGALLVLFWLPAEYGLDPTGMGRLTGLTEMGEIKQQLAAEAEADAIAETAAPTPAVAMPEVTDRLDRIEAQLAAIAAVIGADGLAAAPVEQPAPATPEPAPQGWRDEASYTLQPGQGIEVKLAMTEGQTARFEWTANGAVVNFDLHGDGSGQKISYEQGRAVPDQTGELVAAFTGNHGWFWRNRSDAPVTVTLRVAGEYAELKAP